MFLGLEIICLYNVSIDKTIIIVVRKVALNFEILAAEKLIFLVEQYVKRLTLRHVQKCSKKQDILLKK